MGQPVVEARSAGLSSREGFPGFARWSQHDHRANPGMSAREARDKLFWVAAEVAISL